MWNSLFAAPDQLKQKVQPSCMSVPKGHMCTLLPTLSSFWDESEYLQDTFFHVGRIFSPSFCNKEWLQRNCWYSFETQSWARLNGWGRWFRILKAVVSSCNLLFTIRMFSLTVRCYSFVLCSVSTVWWNSIFIGFCFSRLDIILKGKSIHVDVKSLLHIEHV